MKTNGKKKRTAEDAYVAMSIPGELDDCSDTNWYVYDRQSMTNLFRCEGREEAIECAKLANTRK